MSLSLIPSEKVYFNFVDFDSAMDGTRILPFYVPTSQVTAANAILSFISNSDRHKPSFLVSLSENEVSDYPFLCLLDSIFVEAVENYKNEFKGARDADLEVFEHTTNLELYKIISVGAMRCASYTPKIPAVEYVVGPILLFLGGIYGCLAQKRIADEIKRDEYSQSRIVWLNRVVIKEEIRIKKNVDMIKARIEVLKRDIEEQVGNIINTDSRRELLLLNRLVQSISPESVLKIDGYSVLEYLKNK